MPTVTAPTRVKLQNILFATDFTPSAQLALSYALNLAHSYDAGVYSVNVLPHMPFVEAVQPDPEQIRLLAEQQLAALAGSELFKGYSTQGDDRAGRSSGSALKVGVEV